MAFKFYCLNFPSATAGENAFKSFMLLPVWWCSFPLTTISHQYPQTPTFLTTGLTVSYHFHLFEKKKTCLREGLQISTHQAVEGDSISKHLKLGVQFLSKENKPNQSWRYAGSRRDQNDWCVIFPLLRTQRSLLKTPQQENVSDLVPCNITAIKQTVNTIKPTVLNYTILFWITRSFRK